MNRAAFYRRVRASFGPLDQAQVAGTEMLLDAVEGAPLSHRAYMLATAWHETATTMQPIKERGGPAYLKRMYDVAGDRRDLALRNGNNSPGDGVRFCGRGYVQLTWKDNYRRAGEAIGVDLIADPDRAMEPALAARIMREGMTAGWFTGRRLASYLPSRGTATRAEYVEARRIINGTDRADLVEDYAQVFERALRDGGVA